MIKAGSTVIQVWGKACPGVNGSPWGNIFSCTDSAGHGRGGGGLRGTAGWWLPVSPTANRGTAKGGPRQGHFSECGFLATCLETSIPEECAQRVFIKKPSYRDLSAQGKHVTPFGAYTKGPFKGGGTVQPSSKMAGGPYADLGPGNALSQRGGLRQELESRYEHYLGTE